jgi:hypothetical protein
MRHKLPRLRTQADFVVALRKLLNRVRTLSDDDTDRADALSQAFEQFELELAAYAERKQQGLNREALRDRREASFALPTRGAQ